MITLERFDDILNTIIAVRNKMSDQQAVEAIALYPEWNGEGKNYIQDDRVLYNNKLYKVLQDHVSQLEWNPVVASSLFAQILGGQNGTEIEEWQQPDSTNPYMIGDRCYYNGQLYESTIDNNIWSPTDYPTGWQLII